MSRIKDKKVAIIHILSFIVLFRIIFWCYFLLLELMCLMKYLLVKKKHFDQHEKDGKLKVTGNELSVSSDRTKSIEYPRARLGNCFRERNVYFFFFFLLSDSSSTPLPVDERRNQLREAPEVSLLFRCLQLLTLLPRRARRAFSKAP